MSAASFDGPSPDRLARARCLVPLLGHVAVRLASLAPVLRVIRETKRLPWAEGAEQPEEPQRQDPLESLSGAAHEVQIAGEQVLAVTEAVARFSAELAELCSAEGQWLAILALAPKVVQKFGEDFAELAATLDRLAQRLSDAGASSASSEPSGGLGSHVATQPGAAKGVERQEEAAAVIPDRGAAAGLGTGHSTALQVLLTTVSADLRADLEGDILCSKRMAPELEAAHELWQWLLPQKSEEHSDVKSGGKQARVRSEGDQQVLIERIAQLGGGCRPVSALVRELEAAEQYCRVIDGTASLPASSRVAESRLSGGGRDALVSEAQASGGSAFHRWIRAQVAESQGGAGEPPAGATSGSGGARGSSSKPAFVKLSDIPHEFLCPITQDVMRDAVSTCDGHTYERRNIEAWLAEKSTSPITGLPLANKALIPNHNLRKLILDSGVLSRLEPDTRPDAEGTHFRGEVCCEIVVPRDAATLAEALYIGASRAQVLAAGNTGTVPGGGRLPPGNRMPSFGIRLLTGEHLVQQVLQVDQAVEIIGSGRSITILRLAPEATLELRGSVQLAHFAMCRDAASSDLLGESSVGSFPSRVGSVRAPALVEVTQGSCRVEQCDLCNIAGSAIRVSGAHTSPTITRNTIHGCRDTGVVFKDGADGSLINNRLFGNCSVAIEVHSRANPLIEDNDIFDGRQGGVFVYNRGKGHLRRNKIFRNALEGVEIKQGGRPLVDDNDIYDNLECGIFIHEGGEGRVIGNRIHSNAYAGIEIKDASSPEVRGNDVYSGRTSGMYVHSGGQGVIDDNNIYQNWLHGVYVRSKGCPHLIQNKIFRNDECGIFVTESSHPCIEDNEVHSNGLAGIEVKEDSNPTVKLNRIHDGNTGGIFVLARGRGRIFENKLYSNKLEGIEIKDGGDPQVIDNDIYENLECGVFAHDGALGRIEDNRIFTNAYAGIEIKDMSSPIVKNNRIYFGQTSGIYVHSGGQGKLIENDVYENGLHGIMILSGGNPWMSQNKVHDNIECGVVAHVSYALDTVSNQIYSNRIKNVQTVKS